MSIQLRVGGWWVDNIAPWGELEWSHAADGGCKGASWRMDLPDTYSHSALVRNKIVEIRFGPRNVWKGVLTEPDMDDGWTFHAVGLSALGADFLCLDGAGNTTSTPNTAVDQAIIRGLPWTRPSALSATSFTLGDSTDSLNYVGALLDAWADNGGKRWGVDSEGAVYATSPPTQPTWILSPDSARFGLADDEYASDLYGRYVATGGYATTTVGETTARAAFGRREYGVDLTSLGLLTVGAAQTQLNGLLAKGKARMGYTNGAEVNKYQLTTPGGTPACLPLVKGGQLVRMFGVLNEQGQPIPYVDWEIGETSYTAGADDIGLTPVGLVDRTLGDVLSAVVA